MTTIIDKALYRCRGNAGYTLAMRLLSLLEQVNELNATSQDETTFTKLDQKLKQTIQELLCNNEITKEWQSTSEQSL